MTTFSPLHVDPAVRSRDPFAQDVQFSNTSRGWATDRSHINCSTHRPGQDCLQPLTPPPEMNAVHTSQLGCFPQEHGYQFGEYLPAQSAGKYSVAPSQAHDSSYRPSSSTSTLRSSPVRSTTNDAVSSVSARTHRRQISQASAANFQAPTSVNCTGEKIHELAAQITCLFWFESSDVLQTVEDSLVAVVPQKSLVPDARPTADFRKWVTHVLSTTRVADNVILLALLFIYRLKKQNPKVRGKPGKVSLINVAEVHIMEVEFLSNMKYCLFTSERDWLKWQSLLGRFASFYSKATRLQPHALVPILPPNSSLQLPRPLPSPPASNNASPPYASTDAPTTVTPAQGSFGLHGLTPAPSPLARPGESIRTSAQFCPRKRSLDETAHEPAAKRMSTGYPLHISPQRHSNLSSHFSHVQPAPRLTLPSLSTSNPQSTGCAAPPPNPQMPQLPPLNVPARAMTMVYPNASTQSSTPAVAAVAGLVSQNQTFPGAHQQQVRHHSPYGSSAVASPTTSMPTSATALYPPAQISPSYFLQQRSSPYRPVHHVSTLLYPPPTAAMQARAGEIELNQMQYQPLGKPTQHTGRLPYLAQNQWVDGSQPHDMTPVHQWPGFINTPH